MTTAIDTMIITKDDALRGLREAVAERGADYIYRRHTEGNGPACTYWYKGKPDCMIALALFKLGVPGRVIADLHGSIGGGTAPAVLAGHGFTFTRDALDVFAMAQRVQDGGESTWGDALNAALTMY